MAIARPVRALIGLAAVLWCFFLYQCFKPTPEIHGPGDRYMYFERDPNLDRKEAPKSYTRRWENRGQNNIC